MANTADYDRWNGPNNMPGQGYQQHHRSMGAPWHPLRIVLIVPGHRRSVVSKCSRVASDTATTWRLFFIAQRNAMRRLRLSSMD